MENTKQLKIIKKTKEYLLWSSMLDRCYSRNYHSRKNYLDVTVCEDWKCFQFFCEDIKNLQNYNEWKNNLNYQLDKDKLTNLRIYSKETCCFISKSENISISNKKHKISGETYIAVRLLDGYEEEFLNKSEFSKKYNLTIASVCNCINKKQKTTKGWKFFIKKEGFNG